MKRALLIVLALLTGCGRTDTPAPKGKVAAEVAERGPRLVGNPPTVQVELPPRMTQALAADDTSFTTLTPFDFVPDIVPGDTTQGAWRYPYDGRQAPSAVIGDFDGDGRDDVALLQRSHDAGRVVVVFDLADGPRVASAKTWNLSTAGEREKSGFYLTRWPKGPYRVPDFGGAGDTARHVDFAHEGINVSNFGKAATAYSWTGERFEPVTTAD